MTDESYDMTTIEGCVGWGLFRNPPERRRLESELARLRAIEAAARHLGRCWEQLCRCVDEFEPEDMAACAEWRDALDTAVEATIAALGA